MQKLETNLNEVEISEAIDEKGQVKQGYVNTEGKYYRIERGIAKLGNQLVYFIKTGNTREFLKNEDGNINYHQRVKEYTESEDYLKLCFVVNGINNDDFVIPHPVNFKFERPAIVCQDILRLEEKVAMAIREGKYLIHVRNCRFANTAFNETIIPDKEYLQARKQYEKTEQLRELDVRDKKLSKDLYPDIYKKVNKKRYNKR